MLNEKLVKVVSPKITLGDLKLASENEEDVRIMSDSLYSEIGSEFNVKPDLSLL